jgi:peptidase M23-like protein
VTKISPANRSLAAVLAAFLCATQVGSARERGPRVEVSCPSNPVASLLADRQVFVYELHLTNFDLVPLSLKRVDVFADTARNQPLKSFSGDALAAMLQKIGSGMHAKSDATIEPGQRTVLFMWIAIAGRSPTPRTLHHRLVFSPAEQGTETPSDSTLEDFVVSVSRDPLPPLNPPFNGGVWLVGDGADNDSPHRRSIFAIDGGIFAPERFAIDFVKVGPNGDSHQGSTKNDDFWAYGEPVYAVADGDVTQILDGIAENQPRVLPSPVTLDNIAGNYVVERIGPNRYATYAHLQNGSLAVHPHDHIRRGSPIGRVGNTGNATAPHLHFQITDTDSVLQSQGVPFVLDKFTDLGPGATFELDKHPSTPSSRVMPAGNVVVEFEKWKK